MIYTIFITTKYYNVLPNVTRDNWTIFDQRHYATSYVTSLTRRTWFYATLSFKMLNLTNDLSCI